MIIDKYDKFIIRSYQTIEDYADNTLSYDIFISSFNNEDFVRSVYKTTKAKKKIWILLPEYHDIKIDKQKFFTCEDCINKPTEIESFYINFFIDRYLNDIDKDSYICIDITGFIKPYLIYLILALHYLEFKKIDLIYSEPKIYVNKENTQFSSEETIITRGLNWDEFREEPGKDDLLLLNVGYDHKLVTNVVNFLSKVKKYEILIGFPSLQPLMYQENILNFSLASENINIYHNNFKPIFASANDPFETAKIINEKINSIIKKPNEMNNIYLAPLATKAQAVGMTLFYIFEKQRLKSENINLKIVYPFTKSYSSNTCIELYRINKYHLNF